jgi:hypothetical protein
MTAIGESECYRDRTREINHPSLVDVGFSELKLGKSQKTTGGIGFFIITDFNLIATCS